MMRFSSRTFQASYSSSSFSSSVSRASSAASERLFSSSSFFASSSTIWRQDRAQPVALPAPRRPQPALWYLERVFAPLLCQSLCFLLQLLLLQGFCFSLLNRDSVLPAGTEHGNLQPFGELLHFWRCPAQGPLPLRPQARTGGRRSCPWLWNTAELAARFPLRCTCPKPRWNRAAA